MMNHQTHTEDFYKIIRENRMMMYSKPKRYFNRDEQKGSAFKFLFLVETIVFLLLMAAAGTGMAQGTLQATKNAGQLNSQATINIHNYSTAYNSGKVFVSWTSKNEQEDCVYVVERSADGREFQSVGIKEGIGSDIELYYSWIDQAPPAGFAYYRVKKITKEGTQLYSSVSSVINQSSNFGNYAQGEEENK
ncbi:MAG: hypothetical protein JNL88_04745 [Bacteroidia bacterium]|nr:hypothetical protein [Bacteroidia bacterium]